MNKRTLKKHSGNIYMKRAGGRVGKKYEKSPRNVLRPAFRDQEEFLLFENEIQEIVKRRDEYT